ncbi:hypothetical protein H8356DRAFT_957898 [Neocallimastix lanati (nom. inval.)]|jgi:uncharacterized membrane protein YozB (DUF420 family)|nr:hypothetical protein H8356DRAFT_957898 [Neocallimastix sp. JGI-2020a]
MKRTISKRESMLPNDYIYPDFKKCQIILFFLAFLEYLNILVLTFCNVNLKLDITTRKLFIIFTFEFFGLIFVVLALKFLNKKKWRNGKKVIMFFAFLLTHLVFYVISTVLSCVFIWNAFNRKKKVNPISSFSIIFYTVCSGLILLGQIIYFIILSIYTKNTWRSGDESLV